MSTRPTVAPPKPWAFPVPERFHLPNGLRVLLYHRPGQKVISTRVVVPVPLSAEPRSVEGVATIVSRTLDEGTTAHSADELAELLERHGVAYGASFGQNGLTLDTESTARGLHLGWELLTEFLSQPAFDENEVNRHVRQRIAEIDHQLANPGSRAALEWVKTYYTPQSRASRPTAGSAESVGAITPDHCRDFYRYLSPQEATLILAGDLDDPREALTSTFGAWSPSSVPAPSTPDELAADRARIVFVDRPGSVQTELYVGQAGPARNVPWAPYPVLGFVLGGAPTARIDAVLREEKGYTYGIRAGFRPRKDDGTFLVSGSVRADVTADALDLLLGILDGATEFSADEVRHGADYVARTAPGRYATADVVADEAAGLALFGLGTDYVTDYLAQLPTLTADEVGAAWSLWRDTPRSIVLVGDATEHAAAVEALGRGSVTVVN
ncbi:putative Zn-dependent peptidase [Branchiibius hedensis]|uniref:Predicted Zn-dependent peptidase n=1 Tax=Branchiibius hedensis TaxID=672460 RepID=A0A2Y8ZLK7_9MICO|nr:pitrilysin family protein [Branchiibius hedensis]PWJ24403.1 putative Zn-dependent peptidase [Branchiibius hedensis]SSA33220.1 Predicted Zn-dependent peptidase [Branchiibius hedensis]